MGDENNNEWLPLRELAPKTKYKMGYLSLMCRRGQLKGRKEGKTWHSTLNLVKEFENEMEKRKNNRKQELSKGYFERAKVNKGAVDVKSRIKIMGGDVSSSPEPSGSDMELEEAQSELEEVLSDIKSREEQINNEGRGESIPIKGAEMPESSLPEDSPVTEQVISGLEGSLEEEKPEEAPEGAFSIPIREGTGSRSQTDESSPRISDITSKSRADKNIAPLDAFRAPLMGKEKDTAKKPQKSPLRIIGIILILLSLCLAAVLILSVI